MALLPYCISEKRNSVAAIAFDEFLNVAADDDGSSDVVARCREGEFDGDFFPCLCRENDVSIVGGRERQEAAMLLQIAASAIYRIYNVPFSKVVTSSK